jgi:hypothetical protein
MVRDIGEASQACVEGEESSGGTKEKDKTNKANKGT